MKKRNATAVWQGTGKDGKGTVSSQSGALVNMQYSYKARFEEGPGTNPEELIAAAHAGCFSMKLAFNIDAAGFTAEEINTKCEIVLDEGAITGSHLTLTARIPGISHEKFDEVVADAKANCPVSKLLKAEKTEISVSSTLE